MDRRRKGESGLTLVELLVVVGIIAIITSVSIPILARTGLFTSSKADLAAREVFTILRAAKIYATTHNVETAVAYGIRIVDDDSFSFLEDCNGQPVVLPVVDSMTVVRRLKRKEILELLQTGVLTNVSVNTPLYVQVHEGNSNFKRMPNGTCILPDFFEFDSYSATGLTDVIIFDPIDGQFLSPRTWFSNDDINKENPFILSYALSSDPNAFPAHRFSPEGALLADVPQQRLRFRVGILPSADPSDRFFVDIGDVRLMESNNVRSIPILFSELGGFPCKPMSINVVHDPDRLVSEEFGSQIFDTPIDIDVEILLYVATGRVKVVS